MMQQLMKLVGVSVQEQVQPEGEYVCVESGYCVDTGESMYCDSKGCRPTYNMCC